MQRGAVVDAASLARWGVDGTVDERVAAAAELGLTQLRIGVGWSQMQPRAGGVDGGVVERYRHVASACAANGVQCWFTLLQTDMPRWFDNEGGFSDARLTGRYWPRWVEQCAHTLGDVAAGWVPFEAPYTLASRLEPDDPQRHGDVLDTLVVAWRDAWRILRGGPPVATSLDVAVVRPSDDTLPAAQAARRIDDLRWRLWLQGLRDGTVSIPGRADRELADFAGAADVIGVAVKADVETVLYRTAEMAPDRPLALTFRATGGSDAERASQIDTMWHSTRHARAELRPQSAMYAPFDGERGLITERGEVGDAGRAWCAEPR
jgi:hypothetical protein